MPLSVRVLEIGIDKLHKHDETKGPVDNRCPHHDSGKSFGSILQFFGHMDSGISAEKRCGRCNQANKSSKTSFIALLARFCREGSILGHIVLEPQPPPSSKTVQIS